MNTGFFGLLSTNRARGPSGGAPAATYYDEVMADSPVAYWRLGESSGTTMNDVNATYNGTYSAGGVTYSVTGAVTGANTAVTLNGSTGYAYVADNAAWDVTSGTVECWFKTSASGSTQTIARRDGLGSDRAFAVVIDSNGKVYAVAIYGGNPSITSSASFNDGNWHHLAFKWAASGGNTDIELFIDGSSVGTAQASANAPAIAYQISFGSWDGGSDWLNGSMDEIAFYNTALSSTRIAAHYAAQ